MSEWISVNEKLPEKESFYQTYHESGSIRIDLCFDKSLQRFEEEHPMGWWVEPKSKVTHWKEMPKSPEMKDE